MTQQEMLLLVPQKLKEIEKEYGVRILYAVESGSRAWGTCSEHSDFDVRFIFVRPKKEYLRLDSTRDVLEFPIADGWDMGGWDLSKLLKLLQSTNSQIYEWFASPLVYMDDGLSERIRPLLDTYFAVKTAAKHYLHQADMKMKQALRVEEPKVKHYLYTMQHLAAARWILQKQEFPPISFDSLVPLLPEAIRQEAAGILFMKTMQSDQPRIPHMRGLEDMLAEEWERLREEIYQLPKVEEKDWDMLNQFFLAELDR